VSRPASNNSTRLADRAESRLAKTHPAAPPPTMMTSNGAVIAKLLRPPVRA
jgi:hypothetical protein